MMEGRATQAGVSKPLCGKIRRFISRRIGLTLILAAIGGWAFSFLHLPMPWMLGAMVVTMITGMAGAPLAPTRPMRPPFAAILGVALGSTFRPAAFEQGGILLVLLPAIIISTALCGVVGYQYLRRVAGFDTVTAYFAAMPAGLQEMTLQGGQAGGDERRIALIHGCRIFLLVLAVPLVYATLFGADSQKTKLLQAAPVDAELLDWLILLGTGALGWGLARYLRIPNAAMIGPLMLSAAAHLSGLSPIAPPQGSIFLAQIVLGSSLGSNFVGTDWRLLRQCLQHGLVLVPIFAGICLGIAMMAGPLIGLKPNVLFLALAPGGTTEMSLIALALHANVALVTSSQMVRILLVNLGATSLSRLSRRRP